MRHIRFCLSIRNKKILFPLYLNRRLHVTIVKKSSENNTENDVNKIKKPPYSVEGGFIPIYQFAYGRIYKRNWVFENPQWCSLCNEPVDLWVNHMGRKDHALMDQHYTMLVEWPRRHDPCELLSEVFRLFDIPLDNYNQVYGMETDLKRRKELFSLISFLESKDVLHLGETKDTFLSRLQGGLRGMDIQGSLVLHELMLRCFLRLYPEAHIQDLSNLVDFITCAYNLETVYDLCGFRYLDKVTGKNLELTSPSAVGLGGVTTHSSPESGFSRSVGSNSATSSKALSDVELDEAFSRKASFLRLILGQLRWVMFPEQEHPTGTVFPLYIIELATLLLKGLVAEIISTRICEYIVRSEVVWRRYGSERIEITKQRFNQLEKVIHSKPLTTSYRPLAEDFSDLFSFKKNFITRKKPR